MTINFKDTGETSPNATYAFGAGGLLNTPGIGAPRKRQARAIKGRFGSGVAHQTIDKGINAALWASKEIADPLSTFVVFKGSDGNYRWLATSSNAYFDHDRESVSQKAQNDDIDTLWGAGDFGPLRWWHMGDLAGGVDIGDCDFAAMNGLMRIESGTFKDRAVALAVKSAADKLGVSLGFTHPRSEPDAEGVYHHIHTFERSLLPKGNAANPFTAFAVQKENQMATMDQKWKEFVGLFGGDEARAKEYINANTQQQKELDGMNIRHKSLADEVGDAVEMGMKQGGSSGPDEKAAMFEHMRDAGDYDPQQAGEGGKGQRSSYGSTRGRGASKNHGATNPNSKRSKKEIGDDEVSEKGIPPQFLKKAAAGAGDQQDQQDQEQTPAKKPNPFLKQETKAGANAGDLMGGQDDGDGADAEDAADQGVDDASEGDASSINISEMTIAELQQALAEMLSKLLMASTKELTQRVSTLEIASNAQTTKEGNRLAKLERQVKELRGDMPDRPGYRASREGSLAGDSSRVKEAQPYVDPLVANALQGLFQQGQQ